MPRAIDLTGVRFGHLTVISIAEGQRIRKGLAWICRCDCGTEKIFASNTLRTGHSQSCGCHMHDGQHGQSRRGQPTPEYMAWDSMKQRCLNPRHKDFPRYGGRGIRVHPDWVHSFEAFYDHVGPRPGSGYSLDRIENDGNYEPDNVRWTTWEVQARNQRPRTPGLKRPGRRQQPQRYAECHPDRPHLAKGLCSTCYQKQWRKKRLPLVAVRVFHIPLQRDHRLRPGEHRLSRLDLLRRARVVRAPEEVHPPALGQPRAHFLRVSLYPVTE